MLFIIHELVVLLVSTCY